MCSAAVLPNVLYLSVRSVLPEVESKSSVSFLFCLSNVSVAESELLNSPDTPLLLSNLTSDLFLLAYYA